MADYIATLPQIAQGRELVAPYRKMTLDIRVDDIFTPYLDKGEVIMVFKNKVLYAIFKKGLRVYDPNAPKVWTGPPVTGGTPTIVAPPDSPEIEQALDEAEAKFRPTPMRKKGIKLSTGQWVFIVVAVVAVIIIIRLR